MFGRLLLVLTGLTVGGISVAFCQTHQHAESVRLLSAFDIVERLDDKESAASIVEVTLEPGQAGAPHRHPGPVFVYVAEGEYELGIDEQPVKTFKAGETFYEPSGCLHRVSRNPAKTGRTRLIAVLLHARGAKQIAIPEPTTK